MLKSKVKTQKENVQVKIQIFLLLICTFTFILLPFNFAYALSINIDPSNIKVVLKPGETKSGEIGVQNLGSNKIKVKAYTEDWVYAADRSKNFMKAGSSVYSCSNWIKLVPEIFELAPKESKKVSYTITSPKNASGGHVSVIFFESLMENREGIAVSGRIGTIVYQDTEGDIKNSLEIKEVSALTSAEGLPVNIKISLLNKGNSHISAKPKISILRDDKPISEMEMKPINTLPGDERTSFVEFSPLKEGKYKVQAEVTYDNKTLKSQSTFTVQ